MNTSPGLTLARGRYCLLDRLAVGGMGEVWRASDELLGRDVAIKILKDEYADDETFRTRFRAEARNTAGLSHPGIAQMYDYGEQDNLAFLVMELVPGQPLSDILARSGRLSSDVTLEIVTQAARALQTAHEADLIHRDIKPGNLIVEPDGVVKVTDFGIARVRGATTMTQTGTVLGTAQYVSPEQAEGHQLTPSTDIYSLGIVAYECLAGQTPFTGESAVAIALAQVRDQPPPLPLDVPASVRRLIERCLDKDPHRRPASAEELSNLAYFARESLRLDEAAAGRTGVSDGAAGAAALQEMATPLDDERYASGDAETAADAMDEAVGTGTPPFGMPEATAAETAAETAAAGAAGTRADETSVDALPYTAFEADDEVPRRSWRPDRRRVLLMASAVSVAVICAGGLMLGFRWDALFRQAATVTEQGGGRPGGVTNSPSSSPAPGQSLDPAWNNGGDVDTERQGGETPQREGTSTDTRSEDSDGQETGPGPGSDSDADSGADTGENPEGSTDYGDSGDQETPSEDTSDSSESTEPPPETESPPDDGSTDESADPPAEDPTPPEEPSDDPTDGSGDADNGDPGGGTEPTSDPTQTDSGSTGA